MHKLFKIIDITQEKIINYDWDSVWIVCGDEGTGKSSLVLHLLEHWYSRLDGSCDTKNIKHMALGWEQFVTDLKDMRRYEMTVWDEAGELSNRRAMSKLNFQIMQAYQVIRGDNLFTLLCLPDLWNLDSFFTKRRAKGLIYVNKRGSYSFWSKKRLRRIVELNSNRFYKSYFAVPPTCTGLFPKYEGVLLEAYKLKKAEKMKHVRETLMENLGVKDTVPDKEVSLVDEMDEYVKKHLTPAHLKLKNEYDNIDVT